MDVACLQSYVRSTSAPKNHTVFAVSTCLPAQSRFCQCHWTRGGHSIPTRTCLPAQSPFSTDCVPLLIRSTEQY